MENLYCLVESAQQFFFYANGHDGKCAKERSILEKIEVSDTSIFELASKTPLKTGAEARFQSLVESC